MVTPGGRSSLKFIQDVRIQYILEMVTVSLGIKDPLFDIRLKFIRKSENEKMINHFIEGFTENVHFDDVGFLIFYKSTEKGFYHYKIKKKSDATSDEVTVASISSKKSAEKELQNDMLNDTAEENTENEEDDWQVLAVPHDFHSILVLDYCPDEDKREELGISTWFYVVRRTNRVIPTPKSMAECAEILPQYFETGYINRDELLITMNSVMQEIYFPMLSYGLGTTPVAQTRSMSMSMSRTEVTEKTTDNTRDEFTVSLHRFTALVSDTIACLTGSFNLTVPELEFTNDKADLLNRRLIKAINQTVRGWGIQITDAVNRIRKSRPDGNSPLSEVDFWRQRNNILTSILEQLKLKPVQRILRLWSIKAKEEYERPDVVSLHTEAKDNLRFMVLVERHFKNLVLGCNFQVIVDTIPPMMQSLRFIWIISRSYNKDELMGPLMARIAWALIDRTKRVLDLKQLLEKSVDEIMFITDQACTCMELWKSTYFKERQQVEKSSRDNRWEFDRGVLFGDTDHLASIAKQLHDMVKACKEFYILFGPELQQMTGRVQAVELAQTKIKEMLSMLREDSSGVNPLDQHHSRYWESLVNDFYSNVSQLDNYAVSFLNDYFRNIRVWVAFDLLEKLKTLKSRAVITNLIKNKYDDILMSLSSQITSIQRSFYEAKPKPVIRYAPPTGGSTAFVRIMLQSMRAPMLRFIQTAPTALETDFGMQVKEKYLNFGRTLRAHEISTHAAWYQRVSKTLGDLLRKPVFVLATACSISPNSPRGTQKSEAKSLSSPDSVMRQALNRVLPKYEVNFDPQISEFISDGQYCERLNLEIPEVARIVAIQAKKYSDFLYNLGGIVKHYNYLADTIDVLTSNLLVEPLAKLNEVMERGMKIITWDSLVLDEYIDLCNQSLKNAEQMVQEVYATDTGIRQILARISYTNLFKTLELDPGQYPTVKDFLEYAEEQRAMDMEMIGETRMKEVRRYLEKLEESVFKKKSGRSPRMHAFYSKYEMAIYTTIVKMLTDNIHGFINAFCGERPLFSVEVLLVSADIVTFPSPNDIYKWIRQSLRDCMECTKNLVRWQAGSCMDCPPVWIEGQDEPFIYSYQMDVEKSQACHEAVNSFSVRGQKLMRRVSKFMQKLLTFRKLWRHDKNSFIEKWVSKNPSPEQYEAQIILLNEQMNELSIAADQGRMKSIGCIMLRLKSFYNTVKKHRSHWLHLYLRSLRDGAVATKKSLQQSFEHCRELLASTPSTLEELKEFLITVEDIFGGMTEQVETQTSDICERYRIIKLYGDIEFLETVTLQEIDESEDLMNQWHGIVQFGYERDKALVPTKKQFGDEVRSAINMFKKEVAEFEERYNREGPATVSEDLKNGLAQMESYNSEFQRLQERKKDYVDAERLLGFEITHFAGLLKIGDEMLSLNALYKIYSEQMMARNDWALILWSNLDVKGMISTMEGFHNTYLKLPKVVRSMPAGRAVAQDIKNFKNSLPMLVCLKNEALRDRHWKRLMDETGIVFQMGQAEFTLENLFAMNLHAYQDTIETIVADAVRELSIETTLAELEETWSHYSFTIHVYTKGFSDDAYVIGDVDEMQDTLDENMLTLQSMSASRFVGPFITTVRAWEKKLSTVYEMMELLIAVQRKWMYLEAIFVGGDIKTQLPHEAQRFLGVDRGFKKNMKQIFTLPIVIKACLEADRMKMFQEYQVTLETCQKALNNYLDAKRDAFPRFFFISDDELLSILGSTDPTCVQEHIIKMYDNIIRLRFESSSGYKTVTGMISGEGEEMDFLRDVTADGKLEEWMLRTESEMRNSNRIITKRAVFYYRYCKQRVDWMLDYQGMMVLATNQIWFTWEVEDVFRKIKNGSRGTMKDFAKAQNEQLNAIVLHVRSPLSKNDLKKLETVLIIDVHCRDIIESFVRDNISAVEEFEWESQLRFYWLRDADGLFIRQCTGEFGYGYEYMGLNGRLVITPLTDRIYLTITQALTMQLGGAPAGPAGTGKTETTKDLAKAMGLLCIVTNCGEGMDFMSIGKLLNGLCQCGAWGCFDEFNRIDISVLSVVSTQIKTIQNALAMKLVRFHFEENEIFLDHRVGIFITMNPGYAGRTELPESIKALFRPVVVIVPDLLQICEIMLFSQGFLQARVLARKMTTMYKLAREQLSKQYHYDFGLRALKAVLVMAGAIRRENPEYSEERLLMRALRDMNAPKFVFEDVPLFLGLVQDLFPSLDCPRELEPQLVAKVEEILEKKCFMTMDEQVDKVVQLWETMRTRHSTMVVGPTCGGKSVVINTLVGAQNALGIVTKIFSMDPKERSVNELYGILDPVSRDWTDGLLSCLFRFINLPTERDERRYALFDGDVDALWIENMNSVMDDNRLLTLVNGERIRLQHTNALLFEVGDLQYASPATVSRCGMVYVDPKNLGYRPVWYSWLTRRNPWPAEKDLLSSLFEKYVPMMNDAIFDGVVHGQLGKPMKVVLGVNSLTAVQQICTMLDAILGSEPGVENPDPDVLEAHFLHALCWSLGAIIDCCDTETFNNLLCEAAALPAGEEDDVGRKLAGPGYLPKKHPLLSDYIFDQQKMSWVPWEFLVPKYLHDPGKRYSRILVPTNETVRIDWLVCRLLTIHRPLLLFGETGTSKSATALGYLRNMNQDTHSSLVINCSANTTSMEIYRTLESNTEKRTKDSVGPPPGKTLVVFVDDVGMPHKDKYGTQQPIAFLRQLVEKHFFYERSKELAKRHIRDLDFLVAMGHSSGQIDPRFVSKFSVLHCHPPSQNSMYRIFKSIFSGHVQGFEMAARVSVDPIVKMTIALYSYLKQAILPSPTKFHYVFNLRDMSRIFQGMCMSVNERYDTPAHLYRLWNHECLRVFSDRMVCTEDKDMVTNKIKALLTKEVNNKAMIAAVMRPPLIYGDFARALEEGEPRIYDDLLQYDVVKALFVEIQADHHERTGKNLNIIFFNDALDHLVRIHRVLRMDAGHMLLVGVPGCGKTVLTKLAAYTAQASTYEINLVRNYGEREFREDLKNLYRQIAEEKGPMVFLLSDAEVVSEVFMDLINNMLNVGLVPALFADDESEELTGMLWSDATTAGFPASKDGVWHYFQLLICDNLHVSLSMSPVGDLLRTRCRNFPAIVNNTTIDWCFSWPQQALLCVAGSLVTRENPLIPKDHWMNIISTIVYVHQSVESASEDYLRKHRRENHVTPTHFIDFLCTYRRLLEVKDAFVRAMCKRLSDGLEKLKMTREEIEQLRLDVAKQAVVVNEKTEACKTLLVEIETATISAAEKKEIVESKSQEMLIRTKEIEKEKAEAEEVLAEAMPAVEAARAALSELEKNDVTEMRAFATPPKAVQTVGECLCHVFQSSEVSWKTARAIMSDANFLMTLQTIDVEAIPNRYIRDIRETIRTRNLRLEDVKSASKAGAGILKFILAVLSFYEVAKEVRPKRERVRMLERDMAQAERELARANRELGQLETQLAYLKKRFNTAQKEMETLVVQMKVMSRRLEAAEKLTLGLASENERWARDLSDLYVKQQNLVGDCLIAAGFLAYLGPFTWDYRYELMYVSWTEQLNSLTIPLSSPFKVEHLLTSEVEIARWNSQGLPPDELSTQNGILSLQGSRVPVCIDPQMQAAVWFKALENSEKHPARVTNFNNPNFLRVLENAIKGGHPVLIENCTEQIDPVVDNLLTKNVQVTMGRRFYIVADKEVDVEPEFQMFLTTKMANPAFAPSVFTKSVVINYTVTSKGLEDQLLCVLVKMERREIEEIRERLIQETSINKGLLKEFEDRLLLELSTTTGNILDNVELLNTLEETKTKAVELQRQLQEAVSVSQNIEIQRDSYRPAARRGTILFFVLADLAVISPMYQFSLPAYLNVFCNAIKKALPDINLDKRLDNIINTLTLHVYNYGCTGIFERHKLLYSFLLASKLEQHAGNLVQNQLDFFLKGNVSLESPKEDKPEIEWITNDNWRNLTHLEERMPKPFHGVTASLVRRVERWCEWSQGHRPETAAIPRPFHQIQPIERLCLLRCFRIDRIYNSIMNYVVTIMSEAYVTPPILHFMSVYENSAPLIPVVLILSPGSDPASELYSLAEALEIPHNRIKFLSLGQGQEHLAESMLLMAMNRGNWLMLQNCHLLIGWLSFIEQTIEETSKCHPNFRLWLTTDPTPNFPIGILQKSFKVVTEPPTGLKLNLDATYTRLTGSQLMQCPHPLFRPVVFALAFLHAVIQERRRYGKIGWNIPYDFNESDFAVSHRILTTYMTKAFDQQRAQPNNEIPLPWSSLRYLIGEVMYGGRVIDYYDRRVLNTYTAEYFGDFLFSDCQLFYFHRNEVEKLYYYIPEEAEDVVYPKEVYVQYIHKLPNVQKPETLGLHGNAVIGYYKSMAIDIWSWMVDLQPRNTVAAEGSGNARELVIINMTQDIINILPPYYDVPVLRKKYKILEPTRVVLMQELERFDILIEKMRQTLATAARALIGEMPMTEELENVSDSLYNGQIPLCWRKLAPDTRKSLGNWIQHFKHRHQQYLHWVETEPICIWLAGFHIPESYLTALIQQACRKNSWALDKCSLVASVTNKTDPTQVTTRPEHGCNVHGLFLEGVAWDIEKGELAEQKPCQLIQPIPVIRLAPTEVHKVKVTETLRVPVYVTSQRRNAMGVGHVFDVDLRTSRHISHWILQGAAIVLNTD